MQGTNNIVSPFEAPCMMSIGDLELISTFEVSDAYHSAQQVQKPRAVFCYCSMVQDELQIQIRISARLIMDQNRGYD